MKKTSLNELRHRLALEQPQLTTDSGGGTTITWVKITDLWAQIIPLQSREIFNADQTGNILTHRIIIRYIDGVLPEMRLTKGTRVFEIIGVMNEKERRQWLHLDVKEQRL